MRNQSQSDVKQWGEAYLAAIAGGWAAPQAEDFADRYCDMMDAAWKSVPKPPTISSNFTRKPAPE